MLKKIKNRIKDFISNIVEINIINLEYNNINGFMFTLFRIDMSGDYSFDGDLFGLYICSDLIQLNILYNTIEFK